MANEAAAKRYAQAAFEIALEEGDLPAWSGALARIAHFLGDGEAARALENGRVSQEVKHRLIDAGLGDLPILGSLFKSTSFQKGQTELVIVVTPYLVNPVDDSEIHLPTDGFRAADATQQFFLNHDNEGISGVSRPMPRAAGQPAPAPAVGLIDQSGPQVTGDDKDRRKAAKTVAQNTDPVTPGFSLK